MKLNCIHGHRCRIEPLEDRRLLDATPYLVKDVNEGWDPEQIDAFRIFPAWIGEFEPHRLLDVAGTLYFTAYGNEGEVELWRTDGSGAGTEEVARMNSLTDALTVVGKTLYFNALGVHAAAMEDGLWRTDGTVEGTVLIKAGLQVTTPFEFDPLVEFNGALYFTEQSVASGPELWMTDGTQAGTARVKDIRPGFEGSFPEGFKSIDGALLFTADDGVSGRELWRPDGTEAGTVLVKDIDPGAYPSTEASWLGPVVNGELYFAADDGTSGRELWKSDGTEAGTVLVKDANPGPGSSFPRGFTSVDGKLYFINFHGDIAGDVAQLWRSDGTGEGTLFVKSFPGTLFEVPANLTDVNGTLFFNRGGEVWKSDGAEAGTVLVKTGLTMDADGKRPFVHMNGAWYFATHDAALGAKLWKTDGTEAGTVLVTSIGPAGSLVRQLTSADGLLYFVHQDRAADPQQFELWQSDGSEVGTVRLADLPPPSDPYGPRQLTLSGERLYFHYSTAPWGRELWAVDLAPPDPLPGDANGDGRVDLTDFGLLKLHFGQSPATLAEGDFSGDHVVGLDDFGILKLNFGRMAPRTDAPAQVAQDVATQQRLTAAALALAVDQALAEADNDDALAGLGSPVDRLPGIPRHAREKVSTT